MFIESEITPNPETLKFLPGRSVIPQGTIDFATPQEAQGKSPLAEALFTIEGITRIFLGYDFISVTKSETHQWPILKPAVLGILMEHFMSGKPIINTTTEPTEAEAGEPTPETQYDKADQAIVEQIRELLDTRVRPAVAQDGGDITFHAYDKGIVYLSMRGACAGCPSSTATLKMGIENLLRHYIPQITEVRPYMQ